MRRWILVGLISVTPALASAEALDWLQRMNAAVRAQTYQGIAVYRNGDQLETLRIYHQFTDGKELERMVSLSGQAREVLRQDDKVTCVLPDQKTVLTDRSGLRGLLPKLPRAAFEQLSSHYELIEVAKSQRVAGRSCRPIQVMSRDIYRYHYQLCLDEQTSLPLDIQLIDQQGELLEQMLFTDLQYPEVLPAEVFSIKADTSEFRHLQHSPSPQQSSDPHYLWEMQDLPAGFRLATREHGQWPGFSSPVTQLLYSDGLASVSVFATSNQIPEEALQGLTRMGGVNAYGRMLDDFHITVVGEVPQATVRFFGDNLRQIPLTSAQ